ncbi:MAG: DUF1841 family protein [Gammaproteobacteria bacterium]|nr:DUF1841 family protein [Gammaproteobacteria bacterium]MDH4314530.1 DUF1841 family protein [Gammaproteobacteria bacterium]MDH5214586.1 DUF1841 family protein [Gammaproteobacteria bacterium]MDH5500101.1 DUF1841 family protein [Gammaproteobacteria bacterium]
MFGQDRDELRRMYSEAWRKFRAGELLSPLQAQIAEVVDKHPEYQSVIEDFSETSSAGEDGSQSNPWLHMGLHLALREQISTDRPAGIRAIFERLAATRDVHGAEHAMIECLAESLWEAQRDNRMPDETQYLERLRMLAKR